MCDRFSGVDIKVVPVALAMRQTKRMIVRSGSPGMVPKNSGSAGW
jgi:hypothetical protein